VNERASECFPVMARRLVRTQRCVRVAGSHRKRLLARAPYAQRGLDERALPPPQSNGTPSPCQIPRRYTQRGLRRDSDRGRGLRAETRQAITPAHRAVVGCPSSECGAQGGGVNGHACPERLHVRHAVCIHSAWSYRGYLHPSLPVGYTVCIRSAWSYREGWLSTPTPPCPVQGGGCLSPGR
jgi:hypothetical protein